MTIRILLIACLSLAANVVALGQGQRPDPPQRITLKEAIALALQNNHRVRDARLEVDEKRRARDVARSGYFPVVHTDSNFIYFTALQIVEFAAGSLGTVGDLLIPQ